MTEAAIQKQCIEYLRAAGALVWRMNSGTVRGSSGCPVRLAPAGTPDILAIDRLGQAWWIEVKKPNEKLRPAQVAMHEELVAHNQIVAVVHDLQELVALFD